jgi:RsiW-degrading membrane proteinase PrsW (M82 family)
VPDRMSEPSVFHGWRTRVFHWSRDRGVLLRAAFSIVAMGFLAGSALVWMRAEGPPAPGSTPGPLARQLQQEYARLHQATEPDLRGFCTWITTLMEKMRASAAGRGGGHDSLRQVHTLLAATGRVREHDIGVLLGRHAPGAAGGLFKAYLEASLLPESTEGRAARQRLQSIAAQPDAPPCASELTASLAMQDEDPHTALAWMLREGMLHADARPVRERAVVLALEWKQVESLRQMRAVPGWIEACPPLEQHLAGGLLQDVPLQWKALLKDHFIDIPWLQVIFTLLAGGVWGFILIQHDQKDHGRWVRPVLPLIAGVASVWPTLSLLYWQEEVQGLDPHAPFPHDLWYNLIGVGLREELCKLALFAPFLPWLVKGRVPGRALITGAFVGLGFAIEENVQYYQQGGASEVIGRLLTANFLHLALTGIAAQALYRMFRSGFATAGEFVGTFASVVLAHGLYDWLIGTDTLEIGGWLAVALFCVMAMRFFDLLAQEVELKRSTLSLRAAFILGCALIVALIFILAGLQGGSMREIARAGQSCAGIVPVAVLYWRRFEHA